MQFTKEEVEELSAKTCPHCAAGIAARLRDDTKEWTHDQVSTQRGVVRGHTICWANGLRKEYGNG
jgi:hypothetical protein